MKVKFKQVVQKMKYPGVQIDCNLDWKERIKAVSSNISRAVGILKHAKSFLPRESLTTLYTGIDSGAPILVLLFCLGLYGLNRN